MSDLGRVLAGLPELARALATRAATGRSPEQLYETVNDSPLDPSHRSDRRVHALASQLAAERFGVVPAFLLGSSKEVVQGLGSLMSTGQFFGETGFDPLDQSANEAGLMARRR